MTRVEVDSGQDASRVKVGDVVEREEERLNIEGLMVFTGNRSVLARRGDHWQSANGYHASLSWPVVVVYVPKEAL